MPRHPKRWRTMWVAWTAVLLIAPLSSCADAREDQARIEAEVQGRSTQLVIHAERPIRYTVDGSGTQVLLRFSRPVRGDLEAARRILGRSSDELRFDEGGRVLVIRLERAAEFRHFAVGNSVIVTWMDVAQAELRRARVATPRIVGPKLRQRAAAPPPAGIVPAPEAPANTRPGDEAHEKQPDESKPADEPTPAPPAGEQLDLEAAKPPEIAPPPPEPPRADATETPPVEPTPGEPEEEARPPEPPPADTVKAPPVEPKPEEEARPPARPASDTAETPPTQPKPLEEARPPEPPPADTAKIPPDEPKPEEARPTVPAPADTAPTPPVEAKPKEEAPPPEPPPADTAKTPPLETRPQEEARPPEPPPTDTAKTPPAEPKPKEDARPPPEPSPRVAEPAPQETRPEAKPPTEAQPSTPPFPIARAEPEESLPDPGRPRRRALTQRELSGPVEEIDPTAAEEDIVPEKELAPERKTDNGAGISLPGFSLSGDEDQTRLVFDWPAPTAAAVFHHAGRLWIVFDRVADPGLASSNLPEGAGLDSLTRIEQAAFTVIAARVPDDASPRIQRAGNRWTIVLQRAEDGELPARLWVQRETGAQARIALPGAASPLRLVHPDLARPLLVVPSRARTAVAVASRFDAFEILPALQGAVIEERAPGVTVEMQPETVTIRHEPRRAPDRPE